MIEGCAAILLVALMASIGCVLDAFDEMERQMAAESAALQAAIEQLDTITQAQQRLTQLTIDTIEAFAGLKGTDSGRKPAA